MKVVSKSRGRDIIIGIPAIKLVSEVKPNIEKNKKSKFIAKSKIFFLIPIDLKSKVIKGVISAKTVEERTKNIQNINEMSIENFKNKIFNKKKDKNIFDVKFFLN